jgi:hypothetical protein
MRIAVGGLMRNIAAWIGSIPRGTTTRSSALATPASRQVPIARGRSTRSPGTTRSTPSPTFSTIPAPSEPGVVGNTGRTGYFPSMKFKSAGLMGAAIVRHNTSPACGGGTSTSSTRATRDGSPWEWKTMALTLMLTVA